MWSITPDPTTDPGERSTDPAISLRRVRKSYGRIEALAAVDLDVMRGTIFGLVGPNGAGKTTLIRILVGALVPDDGQVTVLGLQPRRDRARLRPQIGYMPQAPVLYEDLTPAENATFFARGHLRGDVAAKVGRSIEFTDLADRAGDLVRTLSGGMKQRASLAAAMVHQPPVLLLDEPTAGVDPELRHVFWTQFRRLADTGVTLLISTHQMDEVVHCDRVAILRDGEVLIDRRPRDLLAGGAAVVRVWTGNSVREYEIADSPTELPRLLQAHGLDPAITRIEVDGRTLEDVVLDLIRRDRGR